MFSFVRLTCLVLLLPLLAGCFRSPTSLESNTHAEQTPSPGLSPSRSPFPIQTSTPAASLTPAPSNTPTISPTLAELPVFPKDARLAWAYPAMPLYGSVFLPGSQPMVLSQLEANWGSGYRDELHVVDARSGEVLNTFVSDWDSFNFRVYGDCLYVVEYDFEPSGRARVRAYRLPRLDLLWERALPGGDIHELVADQRAVLISSGDSSNGKLSLLNVNDGQVEWETVFKDEYAILFPEDTVFMDSAVWVRLGWAWALLDLDTGNVITRRLVVGDTRIDDAVYTDGLIVQIEWGYEQDASGNYIYFRRLKAFDSITGVDKWVQDLPDRVDKLASFDGDVVYQDGYRLVRRDASTGDLVWESVLKSGTAGKILVHGDRLLVGSRTGLISFVDGSDGTLLSEADVWASIEPRFMEIEPLGVNGDELIVGATEAEMRWDAILALGGSGGQAWPPPTDRPTLTLAPGELSEPTATPTPFLIFTPPPSGILPPAPDDPSAWPAALTAFLNAAPENVGRLDELLLAWRKQAIPEYTGTQPSDYAVVDLTGDGLKDIAVAFAGGFFGSGPGCIIQAEEGNKYRLTYVVDLFVASLAGVADLDGDGVQEVVFISRDLEVSQAVDVVLPIDWRDGAFQWLTADDEPIMGLNTDRIWLEDATGDGQVDILLHGGETYATNAGPSRVTTDVYSLVDGLFHLHSKIPDPGGQDAYFMLMDANALLVEGRLNDAIRGFEEALDTIRADLQDDGPAGAGWWNWNEHRFAFAEYQLMLASVLKGDLKTAEKWASTGSYPEALYSRVKVAFWNVFRQNGDWVSAAEAARTIARWGGSRRIQLTPWVGFNNQPLALENVCPCAQCLQGPIDSEENDFR